MIHYMPKEAKQYLTKVNEAEDLDVWSDSSNDYDCAEDEENLFMCEDATAYEVEDDSIFENFKPE